MVSLNIVNLPLHIDEFRIWLAEQNIDLMKRDLIATLMITRFD